jgi:hypothetical protein
MTPALLVNAAFIDLLQWGILLGLSVALDAAKNGVSLIPIVGPWLSGALAAKGIILGIVISFCISTTLGAGHVYAMHAALGERRSLTGARITTSIVRRMLTRCFVEFIPFIGGILPTWFISTLLTLRSIRKDEEREREANRSPEAEFKDESAQEDGFEEEGDGQPLGNPREIPYSPQSNMPSRPLMRDIRLRGDKIGG